jgi:hypothetical protein
MLHPDYQYEPRLVTAMAAMVASGVYDVVIGSRILGNGALAGGMPLWKYVSNRVLTAVQNLLVGAKLSEFHTGFRAFSRRVLAELPLAGNSDDFVFDNRRSCRRSRSNMRIGEVSCPTKYPKPARSASGARWSTVRQLRTSLVYRLWRWGLLRPRPGFTRPRVALAQRAGATCE